MTTRKETADIIAHIETLTGRKLSTFTYTNNSAARIAITQEDSESLKVGPTFESSRDRFTPSEVSLILSAIAIGAEWVIAQQDQEQNADYRNFANWIGSSK